MIAIHEAVKDIASEWLRNAKASYGLPSSDGDVQNKELPERADRDCWSPHLAYEADVKVKLGGYLETELRKHDPRWSVHSELRLFANPYLRSDLSVHEVKNPWSKTQEIFDSCRAVIEIKYANYWNPNYGWRGPGNTTLNDLEKLCKLHSRLMNRKDPILRVLLLIDEGCRVDTKLIEELTVRANRDGIRILSNRSDPTFSS